VHPDQELCESVEDGVAEAKAALDLGASPNAHNGTNTALMLAARFGEKEVVELLLQHGADPNIVNSGGDKALTWAKEYPDIQKLLIGVTDPSKEKSIFDFPLNGRY
jgi:hypothetical protein